MNEGPRIEMRPGYEISRVIRGGWQLAGGHGSVDAATALGDLEATFDAGITTFDCADIYTGVEELFGAFRASLLERRGAAAVRALRIHTKFVPDLDRLHELDRRGVRRVVERSLQRLRVERLDLVQFHWWDYTIPGATQAALWLDELRRDGSIELIGGTNFDTPHTRELLDAGVPLASMQVQYSLLDARPEHGLSELCRERGVALLCYGSVAGGFLSETWLDRPEPQPPFENRSLTKYKAIVDEFGGWALFQELLRALARIAARHRVDIATIAGAFVLTRPQVAAVIVGARNRRHVARNGELATLRLTPEDLAELNPILERRRGPAGDTFQLERDRTGAHGRIMKYNLSSA
jgi:aryl-alcohol dehydrogenase-like predicted oxidoreductase